eukprot:Platyproteum_vivax@DN4558_c0_g1_i1.p1
MDENSGHTGYYTKKNRQQKKTSDTQKAATYLERVVLGGRDYCCSFCGRARAEKLENVEGADKVMFGIPRGRALIHNNLDLRSEKSARGVTQALGSQYVARRPLVGTRRRSQFLREKQAMAARNSVGSKHSLRQSSTDNEGLEVSDQSEFSLENVSDAEPSPTPKKQLRSKSQPHQLLRTPSMSTAAGRLSGSNANSISNRLLLVPDIRDSSGQIVPGTVANMRKKRVHDLVMQLHGYLLKGSKSIAGFEKRWFQMSQEPEGLVLLYYVDHVEARKPNGIPRGDIPLDEIIEVRKDVKYEKQFIIVRKFDDPKQKNRTYILKAKDFTVRDHWVRKLLDLQRELDPTYEGGGSPGV